MSDPSRFFETQTKHPAEWSRQIFGPNADSALADKIHREDPQAYAELKDDWIRQQPDAKPKIAQLVEEHAERFSPRMDWEEIIARARHPESECNEYYGGTKNLSKLKETQPETYSTLRKAHESYKMRPRVYATPLKPDPSRFKLEDETARRLNLPRGYMVNVDEYSQLVLLQGDLEKERQLAATQPDQR